MAARESKVALDGLRDSKKVLWAPCGSKKFSGTLGSDRGSNRTYLMIMTGIKRRFGGPGNS